MNLLLFTPSTALTSDEIQYIIVVGGTTLLLWLIKDTPFGFLWRWYKMFWIVLFAYLGINFVKKELKSWWSKD